MARLQPPNPLNDTAGNTGNRKGEKRGAYVLARLVVARQYPMSKRRSAPRPPHPHPYQETDANTKHHQGEHNPKTKGCNTYAHTQRQKKNWDVRPSAKQA